MRYNTYFANHFRSCRLLKTGRDPHRNRDVHIYMIPGEFDVVGITDGVDAWVAPVATGFLEDVRKLLIQIRQGHDPRALNSSGRRRINVPEPQNWADGKANALKTIHTKQVVRHVIHT